MRAVAQRLIAEELRAGNPSDTAGRAAFRVCEKLRGPLSTLTGVVGFRSLLSRALMLTKAKVPWVAGLQLKPDGSLDFSAGIEAQLDTDKALHGGTVLIEQLLGLLVTFIGEALTLRLVQNVWPRAAIKNLET